jgi:hypothetical protein
MTNPTTPFSWQMPQSTDLVTDLPADFETFGQAVATSMADLLGGTTGQVLSKASNTNMDFTWVTTDDANAIQNSIVDAKGDIVAASANDTPARLAVGSNGETLVADSAATTGLRYQGNNAAGKNAVINGDCLVAQRGTSALTLSATAQYPVDRFFAIGHSGATAQQITSISNTTFKNAVRVQRTAANATTSDLSFTQTFETNTSIPFQGKAVTLSFWARAGANFSPTSSILNSRVYTGTGTDQGGFGFSWTGTANPITQTNTLTTSWQRFTATGTISSSATQIQVFFFCSPTGTAGAADYFDITGVQLEQGSVATAFQTATGTIQGELAACQRYYWRNTNTGAGDTWLTATLGGSTTTGLFGMQYPVTMRTNPSALDYSGFRLTSATASFSGGTVAILTNAASSSNVGLQYTHGSATLTQGALYYSIIGTGGYLGFSAEL